MGVRTILIQARSTSHRFPHKVTTDLCGKPLFLHVFSKCAETGIPTAFLIPKGDPLGLALRSHQIQYWEGDENDVLSRYVKFSREKELFWCIRVTCDCPLISPALIHYMAWNGSNKQLDYLSNCIHECTDGQEVEFISARLLRRVSDKAEGEDREHVTSYIKKNLTALAGDGYKIQDYIDPQPVGLKMSVDTPEDLERVKEMVKAIQERKLVYG